MLIGLCLLLLITTTCKGNSINLKSVFHFNRDPSNWNKERQLQDFKKPILADETFKPQAFDAFIDMMRRKNAQFSNCAGYNYGNVKQMIKDGKLLINRFRNKKSLIVPPLFPQRLKRSSANVKLKDEIDSIKIYPCESNGTSAIECRKDSAEEITCKQDDFKYKIKLKHKDLSQENLEGLIRALYLRLSASIPVEKKKRSELMTMAPPQNDAPFMIVLPTSEKNKPFCPSNKEIKEDWPYQSCKTCKPEIEEHKKLPNLDQMIIECSPRDFEPAEPGMLREKVSDLPSATTLKPPTAYIYSCRWQGKRQIETENILVPLVNNSKSRKSRQSFKIIIDPTAASTNSLPISISL